MKSSRTPLHRFASLAIALAASGTASASTTLLFADGATNTLIPSDYGSRAVSTTTGYAVDGGGTPDITLSWSASAGTSGATGVQFEYYTDATWAGGVAQLNNAAGGTAFTLGFTPDAGHAVTISSFEFNAYAAYGTGNYVFDWVVRNGSTDVKSGSSTFGFGTTVVNIDFVGTASTAYNLIMTRRTDTIANDGLQDGIAIDNVVFSQSAVPEPSAYGLLGAGALAAIAGVRRRRRA